MEKLYRIKESTLRNLTESVKNITGKTEEIVVGNISNEINYKAEELDNEIVAQTTLISEQDNKIAELAEALSGKASGNSGGRSVETCTVEIHMQDGRKGYATTIDANGNAVFSEVISVYNDTSASGGIAVIENVVCNSFIYCDVNLNGISITGTATLFQYSNKDSWTLFKSPSVANEHCIISW